ncbi:MAG: nucleoside-diphosphate sugar epimerase/dehydratase [Prolixibacteraceae bacterium]
MIQSLYKYVRNYSLPRGLVLAGDLGITAIAFVIAYMLRYNRISDQLAFYELLIQLAVIILPMYLFAFLRSGSYQGIIRHSNIEDAVRCALGVFLAVSAVLVIALITHYKPIPGVAVIPYAVVIIHGAVTSAVMISSRLIVRGLYHSLIDPRPDSHPVIIFGAGEMGKIAAGVLEHDRYSRISVAGFIDDSPDLIGKRLEGKPIWSQETVFRKMLAGMKVHEVILAVDAHNITPTRKKELFSHCLLYNVKLREVSPFKDWIDGKLRPEQIREANIEDLLGREPIWLNLDHVAAGLKDTVVLVTGAAGSIGSEIVRQLMAFESRKVILLDQAESPLYNLQNELLNTYPASRFEVVIASVTDRHRMRQVFEAFRPQYVFNAAAYKHVPLMEDAPYQAIRVNIGGTRLLADLSVQYGVKKFVMISTDKAVNPTNVMGASKRICEIYIQALAQSGLTQTQFITTRFGNVLGSNGSVVPLFRKQIAAGGPVTVTHPDIIRYFMTIPEACQLVLEAGFMGNGGEIYVFDMGEPVKIYDLAVKMISLAGLKPGVDIPITFTGLRPGEKLYEELLADEESTIPTRHPKIKAAHVRTHGFQEVKHEIDQLLHASQRENEGKLVCRMKRLVPEFISQNSEYCQFDRHDLAEPRLIPAKAGLS